MYAFLIFFKSGVTRNKESLYRQKTLVNHQNLRLAAKTNLIRNCANKDVTFTWIPAHHMGHIGNEEADRLAKRGAKIKDTSKPTLDLSPNVQ